MSSALRIERDSEGIVTLWLDPSPAKPRGGVVVLDAWLIGAIADACATIARDGCTGLILASSRTLEVGVQACVVEGVDLGKVGARDEDARAARGQDQARAPVAGEGRAGVGVRTDEPGVAHHHAAGRVGRRGV
ncbi:MAG: hypothetical protein ACKOFI_09520, partial [Phycisphaerales bacterium]